MAQSKPLWNVSRSQLFSRHCMVHACLWNSGTHIIIIIIGGTGKEAKPVKT